jgi:hypothetical protein
VFWALLVLLVVAALLFVPLTVELSIRRDRELELSAAMRWGTLAIPSSPRVPTRVEERPALKPARAKASRVQWRRQRALLFSRDFLPSLGRLARRLLRQLKPRNVRLRLEAGLGDPADTGRLWALLAPFFALLWALDAASIELEPAFSRRCLKLDCRATIRVVPGLLLAVLLGYGFTPPPWRALTQYLRAR